MLNALRLHEGFSWSQFEARTGLPRGAIDSPLARATAAGWLDDDGERVRPTALGRRFTNDVLELFLDSPVEADIDA
jgi:oxygen-independent coproporphyrinogen-3 oxidase